LAAFYWLWASQFRSAVATTDKLTQITGISYPCGVWAVKRSCDILGVPATVAQVNRLLGAEKKAHSLLELKNALEALGMNCTGRRVELNDLVNCKVPAILHLEEPLHFVVLASVNDGFLNCFDGDGRRARVPLAELGGRISGNVLELTRPATDVGKANVLSGPKAVFRTLCVELGVLHHGAPPQDVSLQILNGGDAELIVENILSDCSCVKTEPSTIHIAPGDSGTIRARYTPAEHDRAFMRQIIMKTNDSQAPNVVAILAGSINSSTHIKPSRLELGKVSVGRTIHRQLYSKDDSGDASSSIRNVDCKLPGAHVSVVSLKSEAQRREYFQQGFGQVIDSGGTNSVVEFSFIPKSTDKGHLVDEIVLTLASGETAHVPVSVDVVD
jgi:predicted double-glycine peptidase